MQIVIEISEKIYEKALRGEFCVDEFRNSVLCGVVLPKGHGRLADLDAALKCVDDDSLEPCDAKWQAIGLFDWAMSKRVVLEADKESTE